MEGDGPVFLFGLDYPLPSLILMRECFWPGSRGENYLNRATLLIESFVDPRRVVVDEDEIPTFQSSCFLKSAGRVSSTGSIENQGEEGHDDGIGVSHVHLAVGVSIFVIR
jgi:hypothetical protein